MDLASRPFSSGVPFPRAKGLESEAPLESAPREKVGQERRADGWTERCVKGKAWRAACGL